MEKYTQEFNEKIDFLEISNKENKDPAESDSKSLFPKEYYQYKLRGVLLHSGTSESGHYTSIICDRYNPGDKWFEFNDNRVTAFNPEEMKNEAFGGQMESYHNLLIFIGITYYLLLIALMKCLLR